jgi:HTH-type transcriptional regulator/antitoxin HigA
MTIQPIKNEADYDAALAHIDELWSATPNTPEGDQLAILTTLVEAYEAQVHPIAPPDPIEAILYTIESRGLSRRDLEPFLGNRARVSEILNRRRPFTLEMIRRLHYGLRIPAEVLIQPYATDQKAA